MLSTTPWSTASTWSSRSCDWRHCSLVVLAVPEHDDGAVGAARQHGGVGDRQQRRRVDDDHLEVHAEVLEQLLHGVGLEQLGGVRRRRTAGQDLEAARVLLDRAVDGDLAEEHVGEADVRNQAEDLRDARTAQVAVDEERLDLGAGQRQGQVDRDRALAVALDRRGDHDDLVVPVDVEERDVGAQHPERLDPRRARRGLVDEDRVVLGRLADERAQQRRGVGSEVVDVLDGVVEDLAQQRQRHREHQAEDQREGQVEDRVRERRAATAGSPGR